MRHVEWRRVGNSQARGEADQSGGHRAVSGWAQHATPGPEGWVSVIAALSCSRSAQAPIGRYYLYPLGAIDGLCCAVSKFDEVLAASFGADDGTGYTGPYHADFRCYCQWREGLDGMLQMMPG
jgi:hypothetical protein